MSQTSYNQCSSECLKMEVSLMGVLKRSLRKHAYPVIKYIDNFTTKKPESFQIKISDIFQFSAQNIDCGYSLEPPLRGGCN